jgi:hypothetical protein
LPKALALQTTHALPDFRNHALRDARPKISVGPILVAPHAYIETGIQHNCHRERMPPARDLDPLLSLGRAYVCGVNNREPAVLETLLCDGAHQIECVGVDALVILIVADQAARMI